MSAPRVVDLPPTVLVMGACLSGLVIGVDEFNWSLNPCEAFAKLVSLGLLSASDESANFVVFYLASQPSGKIIQGS